MLIQPVLRPVLQPVLRSIFDPGIGGDAPIWTPASLFAKYGGIGGYWDFTDMATLFQDSAGTTPVTAASQPVGRVLDQSGQGNHFTQFTAASRLVYNGAGITPDGVDDFMVTASIDFTGCDKLVVAAGLNKTDASPQGVVSLAAGGIDPWAISGGMYHMIGNVLWASGHTAMGRGTTAGGFASISPAPPTGYGASISRHNIPGKLQEIWWNGAKGTDSTADSGVGGYANAPLRLLARSDNVFYSSAPTRRALVMGVPVAGTQVSDDDIELIRLWLMEGA